MILRWRAAEELFITAPSRGRNITWTTIILRGADRARLYVVSPAARPAAAMTREDSLKGNAQIAEQFGK